jgi:hypothetical protein
MNKQQTASLLKEAANEIQRLRQSNSLMSARLDVFDKMVALFDASASRGQNGMMAPDIKHELTRAAELLEKEAAPGNAGVGLAIPQINS